MAEIPVTTPGDPRSEFIVAAVAPLDAWHATGTLERAEALLAAHPEIASSDIHTAAILGDDAAMRRFIAQDRASATAKGGPHGWDALTHLCFSQYLKVDRTRTRGFVAAATALLDAGASASTGFYEPNHQPEPSFECALYGAAGIAHHPELTRLLLDRGADPNDGEVTYHTPESYGHNEALQALVASGKLTANSLTTMLVRKLDWTDFDAVEWLLEHGADPNAISHWGNLALHHSLARDNALRAIEILLDHGADPTLRNRSGASAFVVASEMGRADALDLFEKRGFAEAFAGDHAFLATCARGDAARARDLAAADPQLVTLAQAEHPGVLANFAGAGNTDGVRVMLDLGFDISSRQGDATKGPTALHLAVWHERLPTVRLLLERGAPIEARAGPGATPLAVAARAQVEMSEWTPHGSTRILALLLEAGASVFAVNPFPTGSAEADGLLRRYGRNSFGLTGREFADDEGRSQI